MKISQSARNFVFLAIGCYLGVTTVVVVVLLLSRNLNSIGVWNGFVYTGVVVLVFGFLFLGQKGKWRGGVPLNANMDYIEQFKRLRKVEKPVEFAAWIMIAAGFLLALTGYMLVQLNIFQ